MLSGLLVRALRRPSPSTLCHLPLPGRRALHQLRLGQQTRSSNIFSASTLSCIRPYSLTRLPHPWPWPTMLPKSALEPRFFSSNSALPAAQLPVISPPAVGNWLLLSSALVVAVVVVGGITRLTESGLSITEWRPITGVLPPRSQAEWEHEFDKYKATPEFRLLNSRMSLEDFKSIYHMEYGHRILGRIIGLAFVLPLGYFALRRRLARSLRVPLLGMAALLGAQGALGWYMVKSGLDPRTSPRTARSRACRTVKADWRFARDGAWSRLADGRSWEEVLRNPLVRRFKAQAAVVAALVLLTALSGAFVAGLDAGLVYNDRSGLWRNLFENPTTVQFDHRVLATATYIATALLFASSRRPAVRAALPPLARTFATAAFAMANAGSVALLTTALHVFLSLRRPGAAALAWRQANLARASVMTTAGKKT
ncbi:cytochrome oxidase assembly protein-domain-containing protein [Russula brevipes]|nr:cytochrome oxidase assembly protein-domain-containing protein [Russula brevipes]